MPKMHHSTIRCEYFVLIWVFLLWFCLKSYFFHRLQIFLFENQPFPLKFVDSLEQSEQTKNISGVVKPYFFHRLQIFLYMGSIQNDHNDTYMKLSTYVLSTFKRTIRISFIHISKLSPLLKNKIFKRKLSNTITIFHKYSTKIKLIYLVYNAY